MFTHRETTIIFTQRPQRREFSNKVTVLITEQKPWILKNLFGLQIISEPPQIVPISFGKDKFDEGSSAQILCSVSDGDEPLSIRWTFHGDSISSDSGIMTSNLGTKTSFLMINSVSHEHRGSYTCLAKNKAGSAISTAKLNVNG